MWKNVGKSRNRKQRYDIMLEMIKELIDQLLNVNS